MELRFDESVRNGSGSIQAFANDAPVGLLVIMGETPEVLYWQRHYKVINVRYQLRNESTFLHVVNGLRQYKDKHGFRYLAVWTTGDGIGANVDPEVLEKAGFKPLANMHPDCLYLE